MARPRQSPQDAERLTLRLDRKLAERVRVLAARQKRAMSAIAEEALALYIGHAERAWREGSLGDSAGLASRVPAPKEPATWTKDSVRQELARLDATQAELAGLIGIGPSLLSLWLGERGIPFKRQAEITAALKILRRQKRKR